MVLEAGSHTSQLIGMNPLLRVERPVILLLPTPLTRICANKGAATHLRRPTTRIQHVEPNVVCESGIGGHQLRLRRRPAGIPAAAFGKGTARASTLPAGKWQRLPPLPLSKPSHPVLHFSIDVTWGHGKAAWVCRGPDMGSISPPSWGAMPAAGANR